MTVGDLDNDTRPDFLFSFPTARLLGLYRSRSANPSNPVVLDPRGAANALALADVNGDGWLDVLAGNGAAQGVTALLSRRGVFPEAAQTILASVSATTLAAGDFNLDGRADVAVALDGEPRVLTLRGLGDGRFDATVPTALTSTPVALAVGDFNEDGMDDGAVRANEFERSIKAQGSLQPSRGSHFRVTREEQGREKEQQAERRARPLELHRIPSRPGRALFNRKGDRNPGPPFFPASRTASAADEGGGVAGEGEAHRHHAGGGAAVARQGPGKVARGNGA